MNKRSNALADRLEQGANALAEFAQTLTEAEWQTRVPHDGRKVGVIVHHVAGVYPLEIQLAQTLAALPKAQPGEARPLHLVLQLKDGRQIELNTKRVASGSPAARAALKAARGVERVI